MMDDVLEIESAKTNKQQQQKTSVKIWEESSRYKQHTTALLS
jgi:hypothetical protein